MRKGEEKRQELLNTAEILFCRQGYENTSVQDILSAMNLSKGGFYHHYSGKEELLKALCDRRAERAAAFTAQQLNAEKSPLARVNAVLHGFMPLRSGEAEYTAALLPGFVNPEGRAMALVFQEALEAHFLPLLEAEIAAAAAAEVIFPPVKGLERVILQTVNHCWLEIAQYIAQTSQEGKQPNAAVLQQEICKYRRAVEVLLDAPYGTMEIIRVEELGEFVIRNA